MAWSWSWIEHGPTTATSRSGSGVRASESGPKPAARAAGITRPIVYQHFGDLGGLLNALVFILYKLDPAFLGWLTLDPASSQALAEVERLSERLGQWRETASRVDAEDELTFSGHQTRLGAALEGARQELAGLELDRRVLWDRNATEQ